MKLLAHAFAALCLWSAAPTYAVDLQQFMADTQRIKQGGGSISIVWWIPSAFWEHSLQQNASITAKQRAEFAAVMEPYTMFALLRADIGAFGTIKSRTRSDVLEAFDLKFEGRTITPSKEQDLSPEVKNLLAMLKPVIAGMLGQMGEGLQFVMLRNSRGGDRIIDPLKPGTIEASFFDTQFRWRLPLGSLLPPKFDPKTGETFPGNYLFNPYTSDPLSVKKD